jgi:hypothetical protein
MDIALECPTCGKTSHQAGDMAHGSIKGVLIGGLDLENCAGCWDTMTESGAAPFRLIPDGNGGHTSVSIPRPSGSPDQVSPT